MADCGTLAFCCLALAGTIFILGTVLILIFWWVIKDYEKERNK